MRLTRRALLQGLLGMSVPCAAYAGGVGERVEIASIDTNDTRSTAEATSSAIAFRNS